MTAKKRTRKRLTKKAKAPERAKPATTAAILGVPESTTKESKNKKKLQVPDGIKPEWAKYYRILLSLREQLVDQMDGLAKESTEQISGYSLHMADSGTDNFDRDFALSLLSSDQDAIYEIDEALKRIQKGTYGVCELTGKRIPKARLEAIPWTRFTVEAQAQLEREGSLKQRRLGQLGAIENRGNLDLEVEEDSEERPGKSNKDNS